MKVKNIKSKVEKKVVKSKAKIAKKCAKACVAFSLLTLVAGCMYPTAPSRSQHLVFEDCQFTFVGGGADTNDIARIELGTQAMAIETSGTETQTANPTQTTDVKPDIDTTVGGASSGKGLLESAVSAVGSLCKSGDSTTTTAVTDTSANCSGGNCTDGVCIGGVCSDGSCTVTK